MYDVLLTRKHAYASERDQTMLNFCVWLSFGCECVFVGVCVTLVVPAEFDACGNMKKLTVMLSFVSRSSVTIV